jgi:hypothetical protein
MIEIMSINLDGQEEFSIPDETAAIAFHAKDGNVELRHTQAGDAWTIMAGQKESIDGRTLSGQKLYFTGSTGTVLEIRLLKGLLA